MYKQLHIRPSITKYVLVNFGSVPKGFKVERIQNKSTQWKYSKYMTHIEHTKPFHINYSVSIF